MGVSDGTHENLLHEHFLTRIINKVCKEVYLAIHAHVTLEYFNFERENRFKSLLSTSISSAITAAVRLLEEMGAIPSDPHLNRHDHSFRQRLARSLSTFLFQIKSAR